MPTTTGQAGPLAPTTGSLLGPPTQPLTIPAQSDCHDLLTQPAQIATVTGCATATGTQGTVTETVEVYAHTTEIDVWQRVGATAQLGLQAKMGGTSGQTYTFVSSDFLHDGDPKLLGLTRTGPDHVTGLDVIEETGRIDVHLNLGPDGEVGPSVQPAGVQAWTVNPATGGAVEQIITYRQGAWRTVSSRNTPASAAPAYPGGSGF